MIIVSAIIYVATVTYVELLSAGLGGVQLERRPRSNLIFVKSMIVQMMFPLHYPFGNDRTLTDG